MALQKGYNSFVTVTEADDYFTMRLNSDLWIDGDCDKVEQALVTATGILDNLVWAGTASPTTTYPLSWPRDIEYYDSKFGDYVDLEDDRTTTSEGTIPDDIKTATYELAYYLLQNMSTIESNANGSNKVKDLTVGGIRLIFDTNSGEEDFKTLPTSVYKTVAKYLGNGSIADRGVFVGGGA
jgi:hypothetical protein